MCLITNNQPSIGKALRCVITYRIAYNLDVKQDGKKESYIFLISYFRLGENKTVT